MYECSIYKEFRRVRENMERLIVCPSQPALGEKTDNFIPEDEVTERRSTSRRSTRHIGVEDRV